MSHKCRGRKKRWQEVEDGDAKEGRGGDGIVVQLSSLHWPQINTYAMHKILVTTGYWNDNADNCLNVLQPSAREMIKMTSRGSGMGRRAGRRWWRYMFVMCARILNDQWIQWSDAMQNSAVHFINERAGQRRVESTMMTRPNDQNGAKQKANHSSNLNQQQQRRSERRGMGGKHAAAKTVSNEIPMKTREPLDYEFVCMQTGVNFY